MATSSKTALGYLGALFAFWASSCSLGLNLGEKQCEKDADCKARGFMDAVCQSNVCVSAVSTTTSGSSTSTGTGGTLPVGWECLGKFKYPDPAGTEQKMLFVNALDQTTPVTQVTMKLCGPLDPTCSSPKMSNIVPDATGAVTIPYPMNSGYYLDITDDGSGTGGGGPGMCMGVPEPGPGTAVRHSLAYVGDPIIVPPPDKIIRMVTNSDLCTLALSIGATEETTTHGTAVVLTVDCNGARASNVFIDTADVDANTLIRYFKGGFPKASATETDAEGAVAVVNMPAGSAAAPRSNSWTAYLDTGNPDCQGDHTKCPRIGTGTAFMRPGMLTYVHIGPSP